MAGDGARRWVLARGLSAAEDEQAAATMHVTPKTLQQWQRYIGMLEQAEAAVQEHAAAVAVPIGKGQVAAVAPAHVADPTVDSPGSGGAVSQVASIGMRGAGGAADAALEQVGRGGTGALERIGLRREAPAATTATCSKQVVSTAGMREGAVHEGTVLGRRQQHEDRQPCSGGKRRRRREGDGETVSAGLPQGVDGSVSKQVGDVADTVGAVCVDAQGRVSAGVSSGGIALKVDGRVGEAAVYGAGCWAQDGDPETGRPAVAVSVTGVGERVMAALLARTCAAALLEGRSTGSDCPSVSSPGSHNGRGSGPQGEGRQLQEDQYVAGIESSDTMRGSEVETDGDNCKEDLQGHRRTSIYSSMEEACAMVLRNTVLSGPLPRDCGILAVRVTWEGHTLVVETAAVHCSQSMGAALLDGSMNNPLAKIIRQHSVAAGCSAVEGQGGGCVAAPEGVVCSYGRVSRWNVS